MYNSKVRYAASKDSEYRQTSIPPKVVELLKLDLGDQLEWEYNKRKNEFIIRKV